MSNLTYRQQKIQEKRKQTPWRQFVMEICSRNAYSFYRNNGSIAIYPPTERIKVTQSALYEEQREQIGDRSPDCSNKGLFGGIKMLFQSIGMPSVLGFYSRENAEYANIAINAKNIYMSFGVIGSENILYGGLIKDGCADVCDSLAIYDKSSVVYKSVSVYRSHKIFYSKNVFESDNIRFCTNIQSCHECVLCHDIDHQSYCIKNKQYTKEQYFAMKEQMFHQKDLFDKQSQHGKMSNLGSSNVSGVGVLLSEEVKQGYMVYQVEKCGNVTFSGSMQGNEELYDVHHFGSPSGNNAYAVCGGGSGVEHVYCSGHINGGNNIYYSYYLESCSFCLGCIGLKNKSYCIFNKQYTKEEWYEKVDEIFTQMEKTPHPDPVLAAQGENALGAFFPPSMNPFYFNDTAAYLIDPTFTKEEVTAKGYLRRDEPIKVDIPAGVQTVKTSELGQYEGRRIGTQLVASTEPNAERRIDPEILKKAIIDEEGNAYRVIPMELEFLQKYGLPLPRKHWLERMKENFKIG